jgi:hypothetical protein
MLHLAFRDTTLDLSGFSLVRNGTNEKSQDSR